MKKALITGINGQDGHFLRKLLKSKGYLVYGLVRPSSGYSPQVDYDECVDGIIVGSVTNFSSVYRIINDIKPDEIYHLAANSFIPHGEADDFGTMRTNLLGTHNVLASVRDFLPACKIFLASSSEMFGDPEYSPQDEKTPFHPNGIYGISKLAAHWLGAHERKEHMQFVSCGIMYNHESYYRRPNFVVKKIVRGVARIYKGSKELIVLGNLTARRDWGYAGDYVEAMWRILQLDKADDFVISTGKLHSVQDILDICFTRVGVKNWHRYVQTHVSLHREDATLPLVGNSSKLRMMTGWEPKTGFKEMVVNMLLKEMDE